MKQKQAPNLTIVKAETLYAETFHLGTVKFLSAPARVTKGVAESYKYREKPRVGACVIAAALLYERAPLFSLVYRTMITTRNGCGRQRIIWLYRVTSAALLLLRRVAAIRIYPRPAARILHPSTTG